MDCELGVNVVLHDVTVFAGYFTNVFKLRKHELNNRLY